jgi:hypothetical protein
MLAVANSRSAADRGSIRAHSNWRSVAGFKALEQIESMSPRCEVHRLDGGIQWVAPIGGPHFIAIRHMIALSAAVPNRRQWFESFRERQ